MRKKSRGLELQETWRDKEQGRTLLFPSGSSLSSHQTGVQGGVYLWCLKQKWTCEEEDGENVADCFFPRSRL